MPYMPLPGKKQKKRKKTKKSTPHVLFSRRLTLLGIVFTAVCLLYCSILIVLQVQGNSYTVYKQPETPTDTTTKTVTLQAVRGEIYDRNGTPLVTNLYSYDLIVGYDALSSSLSVSERNELFVKLLDRLSDPNAGTLCQDTQCLIGTYPDLSFAPTLTETDRLQFLTNVGLASDSTAADVVSYYVRSYNLGAQIDGIPAYTADEIQSLILLYSSMDAASFGAGAEEYTLAQNVSSSLISAYKEISAPGLQFVVRSERVYHYPGYASHILGRISPIFAQDWDYYDALGYPMNAMVGVSGAESAFEHILHGTDGQIKITLDKQGNTLSSEVVTPPVAGRDIYLTIDIHLQIIAEDTLRAQLNHQNSLTKKGAVVVTDPETGEYLALASAPTFDLSCFDEQYENLNADPLFPMFNRALSGSYAPGKLLRLSSAAAGLSNGILSPSTLWEDTGVLQTKDDALLCPLIYTHNKGHGMIGLSTALAEGCDVFFGHLGIALGSNKMAQFETLLGLGQKTGIELSEAACNASTVKNSGDTAAMNMANGNTDAHVTPAQLCAMMSTLVTGGTRYQSHLLFEVRNFTTNEIVSKPRPELVSSFPLDAINHHFLIKTLSDIAKSDEHLASLSQAMVERGVSIGSFSATAPSGSASPNHAIVMAFGTPTVAIVGEDNGSICICVLLENGLYTELATPVAAAILEQFYQK